MFLLKLTLDALLQLVTSDTPAPPGGGQALLIAAASIELDKLREAIRLGFTGNQLFNERDINTYPKRNTTGSNLMRMILGNNVQLLLSRVGA